MNQDYGFELGWGFYLIILPLVVSIILEWVIKPFVFRLEDRIKYLKRRTKLHEATIKFMKKWF